MVETNSSAVVANYAKRVHFDASPDSVFAALTTVPGLAGWWAPVTGDGTEGGELCFTMTCSGQDPLLIDVTEARRAERVVWSVRACAFLPDWVGTTPTFVLNKDASGGCDLEFEHKGLTPTLECYGICSRGWDKYLPSLRDYVEVGRGNPVVLDAD